MRIQVTQKLNKEYYEEYYFEWLTFRSKFKKWENIIGFTSIIASIIIYLTNDSAAFISVGFLVFGFLMVYEFYSSKTKWLKGRINSKMINTEVTLIFEEDKIQTIGPFTETKGNWTFFTKAIETKNGLILVAENGTSTYLQKKSFENQSDTEAVVRKIKNN